MMMYLSPLTNFLHEKAVALMMGRNGGCAVVKHVLWMVPIDDTG